MEEIISGKIIIDGLSQEKARYVVVSNSKKFTLWLTKKDGNETVAFRGWKELNPKIGDLVDIQYKEEDAEWEKDGQTINFKRRTVLQVRAASGAPTPVDSHSQKNETSNEIETRLAAMAGVTSVFQDQLIDLSARVQALERKETSQEIDAAIDVVQF